MAGLATVFGGSGFVGRYVVRDLLQAGWRVRVAVRNPQASVALKSQGGLGQSQFVAADITQPETVIRAITGSDAVVNLVGILNGNFQAVQADGAASVARAAHEAGVIRFVQMSAIGANVHSASAYGRTKGEGEVGVLAAIPTATILRPSIIFGREDGFINRFAAMMASPVVPLARATVKFQPVYVGDVAAAVVAALMQTSAQGQTYELGGPDVMTMRQVQEWIAHQIGKKPLFVEMPDLLMGAAARFTGWLPGAPITKDQWVMLQQDNVVAAAALSLSTLGIAATPLDTVADGWLVRYRRTGRFSTSSADLGATA